MSHLSFRDSIPTEGKFFFCIVFQFENCSNKRERRSGKVRERLRNRFLSLSLSLYLSLSLSECREGVGGIFSFFFLDY
jgi:hypothetical protein